LLLDQEAREEAEGAVRFHAEQLAAALQERTALDGPWGWVARVWRTHARDVAHWDARIAYHHQELERAKARVATTLSSPLDEHDEPPPDLEAIAERLRATDHPLAAELREVEAELAALDAAHAVDARLHRTGAALVAAVRGRPDTSARGITGWVARWLAGGEDIQRAMRAFDAACREAMVPFEPGTSPQSWSDQAEHTISGLSDRAIEHGRDRRVLESRRSLLLERAGEIFPPPSPSSP